MTQDPSGDPPGRTADGMPPADPALRRMLDAAPDRDAAPHPATRAAILRTAHNAVAPSPVAERPRDAAPPWWKRLWGGTPGSRMPWNAALATVLVATFVTVLWHREPVPDAQLDAQAPAAPTAPPTPMQVPAPAPAPTTVAPDATPSAAGAARAPARSPSVAPREREPAARADARAAREQGRVEGDADRTNKQQAQPSAKAQAESLSEQREAPSAPPAVAAVPAPAPITVPPSAAESNVARAPLPVPAPASPSPQAGGGAPPAADKAAPPTAPVPPLADLAPAPAREAAAPPAALARRAAPPGAPPSPWRGWTHLRIVDPNGRAQNLARAEAAQLGALVEAAIPARTSGAASDASVPPGWRLVLEGARGATLGVLEVPAAPGRVLRWREGAAPAVLTEPPPALLEALQRALAERRTGTPENSEPLSNR